MGLVSSSVVRGHQRTRPMTSTSPMEESRGRLMLWDNGKLGLGQRSRMTYEESRGKAYVVGQWEAGTQVYRLRKEA